MRNTSMNRIGLVFATAMCAFLGFWSCEPPFDLTGNLGEKDLVYYRTPFTSQGNGRDSTEFKFNAAGDGGTYTICCQNLGFADAAASANGTYADKSYFQDFGMRGTFTYDPGSLIVTFSCDEIYAQKSTTPTAYAADYEWKGLTRVLQEGDFFTVSLWLRLDTVKFSGLPTDIFDSAVATFKADIAFNQDNMLMVCLPDGEAWTNAKVFNMTYNTNGTACTMKYEKSVTYHIGDKTFSEDSRGHSATIDASGSYDLTTIDRNNFTVNGAYEIGKTDDAATFANMWTAGHKVSFALLGSSYEGLHYFNGVVPEKPVVDPVTAIGLTGTKDSSSDYYSITPMPSSSQKAIRNFSRTESYIVDMTEFVSVTRDLR
jgi:hypothetical protein